MFNRLNEILGINQRNLDLIKPYNPRKHFPEINDKIRTKEILKASGIPTPETIKVVTSFIEVNSAIQILKKEKSFVIKPSKGRRGYGVILAESFKDSIWKNPSGKNLTEDHIRQHLCDILFGVYSFGNLDDRALIEYRVIQHPLFESIYEKGISDIRLIIFKDKPVMAMLRVPTNKSDGKSNLHQGAIGIKVDIDTGILGSGLWQNTYIIRHPDTNRPLVGEEIPFWEDIIGYSIKASQAFPLNYIGIDIVIDKTQGPMILEMNARPGIQIQAVNNIGLKEKLLTR